MDNPGQRYSPVIDNPPEPPLRDDEMLELRLDQVVYDKLRVLWAERRLLGRITVVAFVVLFVVYFARIPAIPSLGISRTYFLIPERYESTVRLMPPQGQGSFSALAAMAGARTGSDTLGSLAASMLGVQTSGAVIVGIMFDRTVSDRIIDKFDLRKEYGLRYYEYARLELAKNVAVSEDRKSGIIAITVTSRSPQEARDMAQAYVDEISRAVIEVSKGAASRERVALEQRLEVIKKDLDQSAAAFAQFASTNTAINIPEQAKATMTAAARVQAELVAAESELEGLQQIYTDSNFRVRTLRGRIAELKRQVDSSDSSRGSADSLGRIIHDLPKLGVQWANLFRRATIDEAVYEALTKQYEFAKIQEAKEVAPVSVLDQPDLPERKSSPKRTYLILGGTFFFFLLGSAWIIGKDAWRNLDPADPRKQFVLEVWSTVPKPEMARLRAWRWPFRRE